MERETRNEETRREERGMEELDVSIIFASLTDGRPLS